MLIEHRACSTLHLRPKVRKVYILSRTLLDDIWSLFVSLGRRTSNSRANES